MGILVVENAKRRDDDYWGPPCEARLNKWFCECCQDPCPHSPDGMVIGWDDGRMPYLTSLDNLPTVDHVHGADCPSCGDPLEEADELIEIYSWATTHRDGTPEAGWAYILRCEGCGQLANSVGGD